MRHWKPIEKVSLLLAAVMIAGGASMVFFPTELRRTFVAGGTTPYGPPFFSEWNEKISKSQARAYGVFAAGVGLALAWVSAYRHGK